MIQLYQMIILHVLVSVSCNPKITLIYDQNHTLVSQKEKRQRYFRSKIVVFRP